MLRVIVSLFAMFLPQFALSAATGPALFFEADTVDYNNGTKHGVYSGHVKLRQGDKHLEANRVHTWATIHNQLTKAVAQGSAKKPAHFWKAANSGASTINAYADKIIYYPQKKQLLLEGHAKITQQKNSFSAPVIRYDLTNDRVTTHTNGAKRTTIILTETDKAWAHSKRKNL